MSIFEGKMKAAGGVAIYALFIGLVFYISSKIIKYIILEILGEQELVYVITLAVFALVAFFFLGKKWRQFVREHLLKNPDDNHPPKR